MRWTIEFGGAPQDVTVTTSGVASRQGFFEKIDEVTSDPRWRAGMALFVDHTRLDTSLLSGCDIEAVADHLHGLDGRLGEAIVAIAAPDAYTAGLAAVLAKYAAPVRCVVLTFGSREDALAWLREQRSRRSPSQPP